MRPRSRSLEIWALGAGAALWIPAVGVPVRGLPLQPMDLVVLAGLPLIAVHRHEIETRFFWIALTLVASMTLSFIAAGGEALILAHGLGLILPFIVLMHLVGRQAGTRRWLMAGIFGAGFLSVLLFFGQIAIGAERLDFRSNHTFSLPPQFGRGFALFPEVSTFAAHAVLLLGLAVCLGLHPAAPRQWRLISLVTLPCLVLALMFSKSTSFLVVAPILCTFAALASRSLDLRSILWLIVTAAFTALALGFFFNAFYSDRLETAAATRSASMRLASVLAGLSPLWSGELAGVGLGHNGEISRRAYYIGRELGLNFGQLPRGVNSQIVGRIFEEGWAAVLGLLVGFGMLTRVVARRETEPFAAACVVLSIGSALIALLVVGYRGIYTNWIWLALPAALLTGRTMTFPWPGGSGQRPLPDKTTQMVRPRMPRSVQIPADTE